MNPTIPEGYKAVDTETSSWGDGSSSPTAENVNNGLVIEDRNGSQFVWIPVETAVASSESEGTTNKAMAIKSENDYKGLLYDFTDSNPSTSTVISGCTTTTWDYREPDIVSNYDNNTSYNNGLFTKSSLQQEYNKMIESVSKYHGFYVARYELGLEGTTPVSKNASTNAGVTTADASNSNTNMWYGLYSKSKEYAPEDSESSVVSSMIWGSQYDAMMNWMAKQGDAVGTDNDSKMNTTTVTGSSSNDIIRNIFDLYACHYEWTLEANTNTCRNLRGNVYNNAIGVVPPSYRGNFFNPASSSSYQSTRLTLYIKTGEEDSGLSAGDIAASEDKSSIYGATVKGYDCTNSAAVNNWKIFYADDSNIYLISDNYIPYNYIPSNTSGHKPNQGEYSRSAYFTNVINDYTGSASITDSRLKALNNDYFTKGYTSTAENMKSVAYMLDTDAWSVYAGNEAEYAIGGPTVEMLMKSYSEKYGVDYSAQASGNAGYQISSNGGSSWQYYINNMLSTSDSTYVINSTSNAYGMWLASPAANSAGILMIIYSSGSVGGSESYGHRYTEYGFRPIVCLKSDVTLQDNGDGTYTIK